MDRSVIILWLRLSLPVLLAGVSCHRLHAQTWQDSLRTQPWKAGSTYSEPAPWRGFGSVSTVSQPGQSNYDADPPEGPPAPSVLLPNNQPPATSEFLPQPSNLFYDGQPGNSGQSFADPVNEFGFIPPDAVSLESLDAGPTTFGSPTHGLIPPGPGSTDFSPTLIAPRDVSPVLPAEGSPAAPPAFGQLHSAGAATVVS